MFYYICRCRKPTTAKLLDTKLGHLQQIELPVKAAELMLEHPGTIVCPVDELQRTRGIWALRADEELQARKLYVMFTVKRVYCKVSEQEMKLIKAASKNKRPKVFTATTSVVDKEGVSSMLLGNDHLCAGFPNYKSEKCKKWKPMLNPISEAS